MATIQTLPCRFQPAFHVSCGDRIPLTEYVVPVKWWAYDDDRLDGRGDAKQAEALVSVKAYSPEEARKLVVREWGSYATVGTATVKEAK